MEVSGAIFDFDGTLFDSMYVWDDFAANYLRSKGKTPSPELEDDLINLRSLKEAAEYLCERYQLEDSSADILHDIDMQVGHEYRHGIKSYEGVPAFLELLYQAGIPMVIASMTSVAHIRSALEREGLALYFKRIFSVEDCSCGKRHPEIYDKALLYLSQFGTRRETCWVFEDAHYAIETAAQAQYPVVAVLSGSKALPAKLRPLIKLSASSITKQLYHEICQLPEVSGSAF